MNGNPVIDDNSHGMWRRIYIIEFPKKFTKDEMDRLLDDYYEVRGWGRATGYPKREKLDLKQ